jgi:hypothetical protein
MATVIEFPERQRTSRKRSAGTTGEPAAVIILPVIRIDRYRDEPSGLEPDGTSRRRRRRRASRS